MPEYLPIHQRMIEANLSHFLTPTTILLSRDVSDEDIDQLPVHIDNVNNMLLDLQQIQPNLPPPVYRALAIRLRLSANALDDIQTQAIFGHGAPHPTQKWEKIPGGGRRLIIEEDALREMAAEGIADWEIAVFLGCGLRTIQRKRQQLRIPKRAFSELSDQELLQVRAVWAIKALRCSLVTVDEQKIDTVLRWGSGEEGIGGVMAGLLEIGVTAPRDRVRLLLRAFDRGNAGINPYPLVRRVYTVPCINAMWHIDGHHKLIRWKIVIHGGIDGFSRMITYMRASDNNTAETHFDAFVEATEKFGIPNRVRADRGGENLAIKRWMEQQRGENRGSFIQGRSVHNQRIERLWVDLQRWCTNRYKGMFLWLESMGMLDPDNLIQLWTLHFCFIPMLNASLAFFGARWNRHGLRTVRFNSPRKIWIKSVYRLGFDPVDHPDILLGENLQDEDFVDHLRRNMQDYGIEHYNELGNNVFDEDDPHVQVDPVLARLAPDVSAFMHSRPFVDRIAAIAGPAWPPPEDFGIQRYLTTLQEVQAALDQRRALV